jgi:hypothetical protein
MAFPRAPELKNFMPANWEKITRLPETKETAFLNANETLITWVANKANCQHPFWILDYQGDIADLQKKYTRSASGAGFFTVFFFCLTGLSRTVFYISLSRRWLRYGKAATSCWP